MDKKKRKIKTFEDLKVWKCARKLQKEISNLVQSFPKKEQYRLNDQMIRSSRSVARNIAEGYGRYHHQENIQFCRQSRGSLNELLNDLITAFEENYIDHKELKIYREDINDCQRLINGYIRYLKKAKDQSKTNESVNIYEPSPNN